MTQRPRGGRPGRVAPLGAKPLPKEKSAWLGAAETDFDYQETNASSVPTAEKIINDEPKDYTTMLAQFARRGHVLTRSRRVPDGRITFVVTRFERSRTFSHLHDLQAYLNQVMEAAL